MNSLFNIAPTRASLINNLTHEIKELEIDIQSSCITSTPFVLVIAEMYISPVFNGRKTTGEINWNMNPLRATRFCKEDAEMLAGTIRNGKGEIAQAVGLYQAVRARHRVATEMLETLNKIASEGVPLAI
jgi:hypothetical protein